MEELANYYYIHRVRLFDMLPASKDDVVFLGDSITEACEWGELFGKLNCKNRGIGGDSTEGVLNRLDSVCRGKPGKIFILVGINDLHYIGIVEQIAANYRKIIEYIQSESPETVIYFQSVLPINNTKNASIKDIKAEDIPVVNKKLEEICREYKNVVYIDLYSHFIDSSNLLKSEYSIDGVHLNALGYRKWKDIAIRYMNA